MVMRQWPRTVTRPPIRAAQKEFFKGRKVCETVSHGSKSFYIDIDKERVMINWIALVIAGLFEVGFATCLGKARETSGTISVLWWLGFFVCLTASMVLLYKATQSLPIGTAYAVWTGIGAVGTVIMGIVLFREPVDFWRLFFLATLIGSIAGLKLVSH